MILICGVVLLIWKLTCSDFIFSFFGSSDRKLSWLFSFYYHDYYLWIYFCLNAFVSEDLIENNHLQIKRFESLTGLIFSLLCLSKPEEIKLLLITKDEVKCDPCSVWRTSFCFLLTPQIHPTALQGVPTHGLDTTALDHMSCWEKCLVEKRRPKNSKRYYFNI